MHYGLNKWQFNVEHSIIHIQYHVHHVRNTLKNIVEISQYRAADACSSNVLSTFGLFRSNVWL